MEVRQANMRLGFKDLFRSGMVIGRDHMGALANTLIFAYVGASLSTLLLYSQHGGSWGKFFSFDSVSEEVIRSLAGTIGLVATVPMTALLAADTAHGGSGTVATSFYAFPNLNDTMQIGSAQRAAAVMSSFDLGFPSLGTKGFSVRLNGVLAELMPVAFVKGAADVTVNGVTSKSMTRDGTPLGPWFGTVTASCTGSPCSFSFAIRPFARTSARPCRVLVLAHAPYQSSGAAVACPWLRQLDGNPFGNGAYTTDVLGLGEIRASIDLRLRSDQLLSVTSTGETAIIPSFPSCRVTWLRPTYLSNDRLAPKRRRSHDLRLTVGGGGRGARGDGGPTGTNGGGSTSVTVTGSY
jgi:hypothetical protein